MNPWEKPGLTPEEIARALTLEFFGPTEGTNPVFLSAIRAAVRGEREACAAIAETHPLAADTTTGARQKWLRDAIAGAIRREPASNADELELLREARDAMAIEAESATARAEKAEVRVRELEGVARDYLAYMEWDRSECTCSPDDDCPLCRCRAALGEKETPATTTKEAITLRPEVQRFAEAMEAKLRKHDETKGAAGWREDAPGPLLDRLREETEHLTFAACLGAEADDVLSKAADVANFTMMVADVCGALATTEAPDA